MFRKNDPLIGAVKGIMDKNETQRKLIAQVNEQFGVHSRRALTLDKKAEYDIALKKAMTEGKVEPKVIAESEQINELSDSTKESYAKKAMGSAKAALRSPDPKKADLKTYDKRIKGINMVRKKLAEAEYSKSSVDKAIKSSKKKISGKEAKAIHAVLKGRQKSDEPTKIKESVEAIKAQIAENLFQKYESVCENEITLHAFLRDLSEEQIALLEGRAGGVVARPPATAPAPNPVPGHTAVAPQPQLGPGRSAATSPTATSLFKPAPATMGRAAAPAPSSVAAVPPPAPIAPAPAGTPLQAAPPPAPPPQHMVQPASLEAPTPDEKVTPAVAAAPAPAKPVAQTPAAKAQASRNRPTRPRVSAPMRPKPGYGFGAGGSGRQDAGSITNRAFGAVNEEAQPVEKVEIKGSLEKWLKNKYLK